MAGLMDSTVTANELRLILADLLEGAAERLRHHGTTGRPVEPGLGPAEQVEVSAAEPRRLLMSVTQAAGLLGVSRTSMYQAVRTEQVPIVRLGRRTLIPVEGLQRWVADDSGPWHP